MGGMGLRKIAQGWTTVDMTWGDVDGQRGGVVSGHKLLQSVVLGSQAPPSFSHRSRLRQMGHSASLAESTRLLLESKSGAAGPDETSFEGWVCTTVFFIK